MVPYKWYKYIKKMKRCNNMLTRMNFSHFLTKTLSDSSASSFSDAQLRMASSCIISLSYRRCKICIWWTRVRLTKWNHCHHQKNPLSRKLRLWEYIQEKRKKIGIVGRFLVVYNSQVQYLVPLGELQVVHSRLRPCVWTSKAQLLTFSRSSFSIKSTTCRNQYLMS